MAKHHKRGGKHHKRPIHAMTPYKRNPPSRHHARPSAMFAYSMSNGGTLLKFFTLPAAGHVAGAAAGEIVLPGIANKISEAAAKVPFLAAFVLPGTVGHALVEFLTGAGIAGVGRRFAPKASEALAIVAAGRLAAHLGYILSGGKVGMSAYLSAYLSGPSGRPGVSYQRPEQMKTVSFQTVNREV